MLFTCCCSLGWFNIRFYWEWLPAFSGVPGRINELGGGDGAFVDSVFIGGEFTPPVLVWRNDPHVGPSTTGEGHRLLLLNSPADGPAAVPAVDGDGGRGWWW